MSWKKNKRLVSQGYRDLQYLPKGRSAWDFTLACLAYAARMAAEHRSPELGASAARHGVPASGRCQELGSDALVLWHGTSRLRAEKIQEHGLFHKRGLWTTLDPALAHSFCRSRSERFGIEGAVVCLVLDQTTSVEGLDFDIEGRGDIYRFRHGLPSDVVEYVLMHEAIRFTDRARTRFPAPWPGGKFKRQSGTWAPVQRAPVRYSETADCSTLLDFVLLCLGRLLTELTEVSALEVFSTLYAAVDPQDALTHSDILSLIEERCEPARHHGLVLWRARER